MDNISKRLSDLRELMRREHLVAFIFPSTDPHQGEYVPDHWKGREFISGFNGSAGTAVVTLNSAALWTDSRYFIAAEDMLRNTEFQLMKLKMEGTPTIAQWIGQEVAAMDEPHSTEVGIDGMVSSANSVRELIADLRREGGLTLRTNLDPLAQIWRQRPVIPLNPVEPHPMEYAGEETASKLVRIRQALRQQHADGMLMASLDDIAWTLNLRGTDVHCNPVFVSYLLISTQSATLYIYKEKLSPEICAYLKENHVEVDDYDRVGQGLKDYFEYNILLDPDEVSYTLYKAMLRDGIAMVQFLKWLDEADVSHETEISIDRRLTALRARQPLYRDISFDTIAGYGDHAAIIHYEATPETDIPLKPEGLLLLDSGAQYLDGTTDITRTIALGPLSDYQRHVYTLVLKGHIQVEMAKFPSGISGTQLDVLAKRAMWREGLHYLHGTGHGVGTYLNVHEGPHQIRMEWKPAPLVEGMTVTDEPGIYLPGRFGVRIENTLLIVPYQDTEFGHFLQFEPLTLCPIDKRPIVVEELTDEELRWLNDYHHTVFTRLAPHLSDSERRWLEQACAPICK